MAAPDAQVGMTDLGQAVNILRRNIAGTALESSFRDKLRRMISVRAADAPCQLSVPLH